jgi:hypothetical protein
LGNLRGIGLVGYIGIDRRKLSKLILKKYRVSWRPD